MYQSKFHDSGACHNQAAAFRCFPDCCTWSCLERNILGHKFCGHNSRCSRGAVRQNPAYAQTLHQVRHLCEILAPRIVRLINCEALCFEHACRGCRMPETEVGCSRTNEKKSVLANQSTHASATFSRYSEGRTGATFVDEKKSNYLFRPIYPTMCFYSPHHCIQLLRWNQRSG